MWRSNRCSAVSHARALIEDGISAKVRGQSKHHAIESLRHNINLFVTRFAQSQQSPQHARALTWFISHIQAHRSKAGDPFGEAVLRLAFVEPERST